MYEQQCVFSSYYHFICDTIHLLSVLSRPFSQFKYPCLPWSSIPAVFFVFFLNRTNGLQNSAHWSIFWMQVHYHTLSIFTVCRIFTLSCMLHGSAWCKALQRYSSARQSFKGLVSTFGNPRTNMYRSNRSNCHALLEEMRVVHLLANFYTQAMKSIEKVSQDFQCFNWVHLNARHCHLEFGCVACKFPLIIAEVDQTYIRTYVIICACSFSFSTQKERFSAMFFVASSTFMDVDVTWHMMSAWHAIHGNPPNWRMNVVTCVHDYIWLSYNTLLQSKSKWMLTQYWLWRIQTADSDTVFNALGFISTIASAYESLPTATPLVAILPAAYSKEQWWNRWSLRCEEQKSVMEKHGENKKTKRSNMGTKSSAVWWYGTSRARRTTQWQWVQFKHETNPSTQEIKIQQWVLEVSSSSQFTILSRKSCRVPKLLLKQRMSHDSDTSCDAPGLAVASEWNLHQQRGRTWDSPAMVANDFKKKVPKKKGRNIQKDLQNSKKYIKIYQNIIKCAERVDFADAIAPIS